MTVNPCRLCAPLGAVLVFKGFRGMMPLLHGSQGCATYIRRYLISHFREPVDVASSSFTEETAIFGGEAQLLKALKNVKARYNPAAVGIASTCLSETIGDDVELFIKELEKEALPLVTVSTPSYRGSHAEGFRDTAAAVLKRFLGITGEGGGRRVLLLPGILSPADLRHLKELTRSFGLEPVLAPDYSDTLDGGNWDTYHALSPGGTSLKILGSMERRDSWISFSAGGELTPAGRIAGNVMGEKGYSLGYPTGVEAMDAFIAALRDIADTAVPGEIESERSRMLDSYADFHKYLAGLRIAVIADRDLADGILRFLGETGASVSFAAAPDSLPEYKDVPAYGEVDYDRIDLLLEAHPTDLILGSSKAYPLVRGKNIPLVRIGFPVHDRVGGARILHVGYRGSHQLLDRIVNALLEHRQTESPVGYAYQ
ncbi:nitrogenase component 1 [Marispirochaeta sp.]|uniref:nitrogenase component 1 n=1 Tax=Marispirochaeta sp. TaxID=2038653 RepID=UPI0029C6F232|nr:nitrogenase component 1 [Marispirochaeta sp.]